MVLILQMKKLSLGGFMYLTQGHTTKIQTCFHLSLQPETLDMALPCFSRVGRSRHVFPPFG